MKFDFETGLVRMFQIGCVFGLAAGVAATLLLCWLAMAVR